MSRADPSRTVEIYVSTPAPVLPKPQYLAVTPGGSVDLSPADSPLPAAELLTWTLAGG